MIPGTEACDERGRAFLWDAFTSFFLFDRPDQEFAVGACTLCGSTRIEVARKSADPVWQCRAQIALVQKRLTAAEGHPVRFGAPAPDGVTRGRYAISDLGASLMAWEGGGIYAGKVVPARETPPSIEIRPDLRFIDLLDRAAREPKDRFVLIDFSRKADFQIAFSNKNEIAVNGSETPIRLDRTRLVSIVSLIEQFGDRTVRKAAEYREIVGVDGADARAKARKLRTELTDVDPRFAERTKDYPTSREFELEYATAIVRRRQRLDVAA